MSLNLVSLGLLMILILWVSRAYTRSISSHNASSIIRNSTTTATVSLAAVSVYHIRRQPRDAKVPNIPVDFHSKHMPCDLDHYGRARLVKYFPNHCQWAWNNKYLSEGYFRMYKTFQLEAFFFGQYYERLKRYEIDPHAWEYPN